jgi:putative oxidoreductase
MTGSRMLNGYGEGSSIASYGPAVLRLGLAVIFISHGAQKLFGIWGGGGLTGTAEGFSRLGLEPSYWLAVVAAVVEFGGGLLLLLGAFTSPAALLLVLEMVVAIWVVHLSKGFFLPDGYEFNFTLIVALISLLLTGPGALSLDARRASHAAAAAAGRARLRAGNV